MQHKPQLRRSQVHWFPVWLLRVNLFLAASVSILSIRADGPSPEDLPRVFAPADNPAIATTAAALSQPPASAQRRLDPAFVAAGRAPLSAGKQFRLDLLDGQDITFEVSSAELTEEGGIVIHGRSATREDSSGTLSLEGQELTGLLHVPGLGHYQILPLAEPGVHEVRRLEAHRAGFCGTRMPAAPAGDRTPPVAKGGFQLTGGELPPADTQTEPTVIDVLFLYTPQTVIGEGNEAGIHQRIRESVDDTNRRFRMSQINVLINPIHIAKINYPETGSMETDLNRLARGEISGAAGLRSDYKADLMVMLTELENQGIAGIAWDIPPPQGDPNTVCTVIGRTQTGGQVMVLAHELGHLLGCAHDREHAGNLSNYGSRKPYIFGHRLVVEGVTYVSLMGYAPGIQLPQFSNPNLNLDGVPLGVPAGQTLASDGARTVNEIAPYVARYREALSRISFTAPRTTVAENAGTITLALVRTGDLNTQTRVNVLVETASSAKMGTDFTWPAGTLVEFATNQATAEVTLSLVADEVGEGAENLRLRLTSLLGNHGLGTHGTTEVMILDAGTPASYTEVEFPDGSVAVPESVAMARVRVAYTGSLDAQPAEPVLVPYRTEDDTAVAGLDYQAAQGTVTFTAGAATQEIALSVLSRPEAGPDRSLRLIVGAKTNVIRIADEQRPGALVTDLRPGASLDAAIRADGKLLVWGSFASLAGTERTGLARLNADASLDDSFHPPEFLLGHRRIELAGRNHTNAIITTVIVLPDQRLLVAGIFSRVGGKPRTSMVRLLADGALDETFGAGLAFDGAINALAVQADGKILVGGSFEQINKVRRPFLWRLNEDGSVDADFKPSGGPTSGWTVWISAIAVQPDGRILFGGNFDKVDGRTALNLSRLNPDGTFDTTFKLSASGVAGPVGTILTRPDGKIVLAGLFDSVGGRSNTRKLARLNANGTVDSTFRSPNPNAEVYAVASLPDGRLLVGGSFTTIGGQNRRFIARLGTDGSLDPSFDLGTGPDDLPNSTLPVHADGTFYLAGSFKHVNGLPAANLARIRFGEVAPVLSAPLMDQDGRLRAVVHGLPGGAYAVEAADTLGQWAPGGEVRFQDYENSAEFAAPITGADRQFIRVKSFRP